MVFLFCSTTGTFVLCIYMTVFPDYCCKDGIKIGLSNYCCSHLLQSQQSEKVYKEGSVCTANLIKTGHTYTCTHARLHLYGLISIMDNMFLTNGSYNFNFISVLRDDVIYLLINRTVSLQFRILNCWPKSIAT